MSFILYSTYTFIHTYTLYGGTLYGNCDVFHESKDDFSRVVCVCERCDEKRYFFRSNTAETYSYRKDSAFFNEPFIFPRKRLRAETKERKNKKQNERRTPERQPTDGRARRGRVNRKK